MAWQQRGSRRIYYRSARIDGKSRKSYLGAGEAACAAADDVARRRRQREAENAEWAASEAKIRAAEANLDKLLSWTELLAMATLLLAGHHHHRGVWRRRTISLLSISMAKRKSNRSTATDEANHAASSAAQDPQSTGDAGDSASPKTAPRPRLAETGDEREAADGGAPAKSSDDSKKTAEVRERLRLLVAKTNAGDQQALEEIRQLLDEHPEVAEYLGDLGKIVENSWLELLTVSLLGREATSRKLASMRASYAGEHPTPLEKLLVDGIVAAHLALQHALLVEASETGGSIQHAGLRLKRVESAQKRFDSAVKTLVNLRQRAPAGLAPLQGIKIHTPERKLA